MSETPMSKPPMSDAPASEILKRDPSRREFVAGGAAATGVAAAGSLMTPSIARGSSRANIIYLAIDDLNDWIAPLGGYPGVRTPNFLRLANMARVFTRAYTPAPACSPARTAINFGVQPFHSGVYTNSEDWEIGSRVVRQMSLPRFMRSQGYLTFGTGKIFHDGWEDAGVRNAASDPAAWTDYEYCSNANPTCRLIPEERYRDSMKDIVKFTPELSFGPNDLKNMQMPDVIRTKWVIDNVLSKQHDRPFFAALGFEKPHGPFSVPLGFFSFYDRATLKYPPGVLDHDRFSLTRNMDNRDLPPTAIKMLEQYGDDDTERLTGGDKNYWLDIVHAYLATITFTDHCLGLLLDGWLQGPNRDNTVLMLWSDHGWQLGEKLGWRKFTLWERATRVPLIVAGAVDGETIRASRIDDPVSTISLYPTVCDLAFSDIPAGSDIGGLPLDGASLKRKILGRKTDTAPALSTWYLTNFGSDDEATRRHFSLRSQKYRYIAYANGDRELYDHSTDPYEFNNLMVRPTAEHERIIARLSQSLPSRSECVPRAVHS